MSEAVRAGLQRGTCHMINCRRQPAVWTPLCGCLQRGFTYLWTLLLVAFLGIGLAIGSEIYSTSVQRDKELELLAIGRQFQEAIGRYYEAGVAAGGNEYPAALDDLLKDNRFPGVKRHLRKVFVDPMTGRPVWGLVRVGGRIVGVHSLSDKRPIKQDNFEPSAIAFRGKERVSEWVFTYPSDLLLRQDSSVHLSAGIEASPDIKINTSSIEELKR